jgi:hypothetical protein
MSMNELVFDLLAVGPALFAAMNVRDDEGDRYGTIVFDPVRSRPELREQLPEAKFLQRSVCCPT